MVNHSGSLYTAELLARFREQALDERLRHRCHRAAPARPSAPRRRLAAAFRAAARHLDPVQAR
jgi:hypothetical protein